MLKYLLTLFVCFNGLLTLLVAAEPSDCVSCHQQQVSDWQQSDHAKAMAVANKQSVLGDFDNATAQHFSQKVRFYQRNSQYFIEFTEQQTTSTYQVKYTFGHYPLQQYLIAADRGRLQVFPFAWDSRPKSQGGKRWYPIYHNEDIHKNDRLHWQQPLQNWNGMCADCHSDGLKRNFDQSSNQFHSQWDNINVGCQSCHGKMTEHAKQVKQPSTTNALLDSEKQKQQLLSWLLNPGDKVAKPYNAQGKPATKADKEQAGKFMQTCFACHSLRSPLTDGFNANTEFLDQFTPTLLTPPFYHADGQIKEEVYVYGSFLQSKMHQQGVTCLNCHDAHTMKVKTTDNGLCLQCHNAEVYQQPKHIRHPLTSPAGQCVSCHMPETTYMGVDARRDHSFKIPRPDLSQQYNTPNACTNCHTDQDDAWAAAQLQTWHGQPQQLSVSEQNYITLMHQQTLPLDQHLMVINDDSLAPIKRASAILMLPYSTNVLSEYVVKSWVNDAQPLIRLATARVGSLLSEDDKQASYKQLLSDKYKAIRVAAANQLISSKLTTSEFQTAFNELVAANATGTWRGEGNFNQSLMHQQLQQHQQAILSLQRSIEVDPYFATAYVNLAELYRQQQNTKDERKLYQQALKNVANSAEVHYSYGMFLIREGNKSESVKHFKRAMTLAPNNSQYAYLYFLALDAIRQTNKALRELKQTAQRYNNARNLLELGLNFSQKLQDRASFDYFYQLTR